MSGGPYDYRVTPIIESLVLGLRTFRAWDPLGLAFGLGLDNLPEPIIQLFLERELSLQAHTRQEP